MIRLFTILTPKYQPRITCRYLFKDPQGNFHCLFHAFDKPPTTGGQNGGGGGGSGGDAAAAMRTFFPGTHAFSKDGVVWGYSGKYEEANHGCFLSFEY